MSKLLLITAVVFSISQLGAADTEPPGSETLSRAVQEIESLDAMRSGLAGTFGEKGVSADRETFAQVCKPVGMNAGRIAQENGWTVVQMAEKYRNPAHKLDIEGREVFGIFQEDKSVMGIWTYSEMNGKPGVRYFRRITVEPACLICHGEKDSRPEFVKEKYPEDKAYGFEAGDLRGIYSVFIPSPDGD
ncbi:MAG: DUF3365 domain-containing protein [Deltaproteobacteria bacterium]